MAIEVCPENAMGSPRGNTNSGSGMSPRISFSHNFITIDGVHVNTIPIEPYIPSSSLLDSAAEFDFCVRKSICSDQASPSADELFSNGVILPSIQISKQSTLPPPVADDSDSEAVSFPLFSSSSSWPPAPTAAEEELKEDIKSVRAMVVGMNVESNHEKDEEEKLQQSSGSSSKSFWGFKRSRSLHCGSIYKRGLSRVPLLLRSKSTSSTSSTNTSKRTLMSSSNKGDGHQHKENHLKSTSSSSSSSVSGFKFSQPYSSSTMACKNNNQHQKPPLKKNYYQGSLRGGKTNNGVLINPILNVPSANVLGLSSLFSFGKHKTKSKK